MIDWINKRVTIRIPTTGETLAVALVVFLAHGWWDERQDYRDLQEVAIGNANAAVACHTSTEKRIDAVEADAAVLLAAMRATLGSQEDTD